MLLKIAAVALLHPALRWTAPAVAITPHGYREIRPGVFVAWLEKGEELEGPVRILMTMGKDYSIETLSLHNAENRTRIIPHARKYGVFFRMLSA